MARSNSIQPQGKDGSIHVFGLSKLKPEEEDFFIDLLRPGILDAWLEGDAPIAICFTSTDAETVMKNFAESAPARWNVQLVQGDDHSYLFMDVYGKGNIRAGLHYDVSIAGRIIRALNASARSDVPSWACSICGHTGIGVAPSTCPQCRR